MGVSPNEEDENPFRYAGQYYDTETGTYYLRARYYAPSIGRFTQQDNWDYADPNDPLSLNLYVCFGKDRFKNNVIQAREPFPDGNGSLFISLNQVQSSFIARA